MSAATGRPGAIAVSALGITSGAVGGLGVAVLLQQYGVRPLTPLLLLFGILVGGLLGIALPSAARAGRAAPAAVTAPTVGTTSGWRATHLVPPEGMWAWVAPDPSAQPSTTLAASLEVQLVEQSGNWARVHAPNGWEGWVDASQLRPCPQPGGEP